MHESRAEMLMNREVIDVESTLPLNPTLGKRKTGANGIPLGTRNRLATHESSKTPVISAASKDESETKQCSLRRKENTEPLSRDFAIKREPLQASVGRKRSMSFEDDNSFAPKPKAPKLGSTSWDFSPTKTVPDNYICKRCGSPGHWLQLCPTNLDPSFDVPPKSDYCCDICKQWGDHFVTLCSRNRALTSLTMQRKRAQQENFPTQDLVLDYNEPPRSPRNQTRRRSQGHQSRDASPQSRLSRREKKIRARAEGDFYRPRNGYEVDRERGSDTRALALPRSEAQSRYDKAKAVLCSSKREKGMGTDKHEQNLQLGRLSFSDVVPSPLPSPPATGRSLHESLQPAIKEEQVENARPLSCEESTGCSGGHDPVACADQQAGRFLDSFGLELMTAYDSPSLPWRTKECNI